MGESNVEKINGQIFGLVIGALLLLLTAATISLFTSRDVLVGLRVQNIELATRPIDIPFILALLLLTKNLYDFYTHIVCKLKESTLGEYYSMGIMIVMLLVSILAFVDKLFPWRLLLLTPLLALTTWKNYTCARAARSAALKAKFLFWFRASLRHSTLLAAGGALFLWLSLRHHEKCDTVFMARWPFIVGLPCAVTLLFYLSFLAVGVRLFLKNGEYFKSEEYQAHMKAETPAP
ncbi:MAG TPA: hypothetical protein VI670_08550 [Thermoanaerobaculia bacterium]|jgi:hypothetical protein